MCIDLDATLVITLSDDKDGAAETYKRSWGFHAMIYRLDRGDGTGEALPIELRRGNAGANTAADQVGVLERVIAQLPELPDEVQLLARADTAGAVHDLVDHIRGQVHARFSVGMPVKPAVRTAILGLAVRRQPVGRRDHPARHSATSRVALGRCPHRPFRRLQAVPAPAG